MKRNFMVAGLAVSLILSSCGGDKASSNASASEQAVESNFTLDAEASSLNWKGSKSEEDFHTGSLKFKSGTLNMKGEELVSGDFVVDMNSIVITDKELPNDKKDMLKGHLSDSTYFNISKFPEVTVKVNGYKDGKLSSIITVLGKEMKQDIPVTLKNEGSKVTINGKFDLDFKELNLSGFKVNEEKPEETIKSVVNYDLNLVLVKK